MAERLVRRGSVVLVRYPFTDLAGAKVRPAVVITPDRLLACIDDLLCLFISSAIPQDALPTDLVIGPEHPSFPRMGLRVRSVLRAHKLALLHKTLIVRSLGELDDALMGEVNQRLRLALGL